ncbi:uncharacterized protein LOC116159711 isoform X1 [Photinus pyralis]|nr:uncharacterized protein LOC116159711 isoform X1 [Photinus pyralis]XP_031328619.1 uncharacterized protein LOC116159711 isoform X1 [Photinus pyralis]XP_031328620.1 uncharacterized protein LOC116159711 isoform X1 [Photinus pyralis]
MLICPACDQCFNNINILIRHIKINHIYISTFSCKQNQCTRSFQNIYNLKRHYKLKHNTDDFDAGVSNTNTGTSQSESIFDWSDDNLNTVVDNSPPNASSNYNFNEEFKNSLAQKSIFFISKLYSNYTFPRNIVQNVILDTSELFREPLQIIKRKLSGSTCNDADKKELIDMLDLLDNIFKDFGSEYLRFKQFQSSSKFIAPVSISLGQRLTDIRIQSRVVADLTNSTCQYIPIRQTLQAFLELPNVFESICSYMSDLKNTDSICNIIQGDLWQVTQKRFENKLVFPLMIYGDDFEIGNPLGSHAGIHKLCGIYFSLGCLPPRYASKLENIFLLQLCYSSDVKSFGNKKIFESIINDLICLESNGVAINTVSGCHTVYFNVVLILGDNLGLNSMLGLTESFNSNYFCRFCRCDKVETNYNTRENINSLRTPENYEKDLSTLSYGLKEQCVWHKLPNFNITRNVSCDIMHDIWEGVCRYDFGKLLHHFIYVDKFFTLDTLNKRIQFFNFLNKNKPTTIPKSQILKKHIFFSASEMSSFTKHFSLIIGDCIPKNNHLWEMYLVLLEIIEIVTSKVISANDSELLRTLIAEHHEIYIEFFGPLKPKHHLMTHYPNLMHKIGPLIAVSSMRFESKHRQFKQTANSVSSRKNILYTLALKNQLRFCHRLLAKNGFSDTIEFGPENIHFNDDTLEYRTFMGFFNFNVPNDHFAPTWIEIDGVKYNVNHVLIIEFIDFMPIFGVIRSIIITEDTNNIYFIFNKLKTVCFNLHFRAYEIEKTEVLLCKKWDNLYSNIPTSIHIVDQKQFVPMN